MDIDGAKVLMISEKGHYGYVKISGSSDNGTEVCYLAICGYAGSNAIYLFLCDDNIRTEQDIDFVSVEEAVANAQSRSQNPIAWLFPNGEN